MSLSPLTGERYTLLPKGPTFLNLPPAAFQAERRGLSGGGGVEGRKESASLSLSEDSVPEAEVKEEEGVRGGVRRI